MCDPFIGAAIIGSTLLAGKAQRESVQASMIATRQQAEDAARKQAEAETAAAVAANTAQAEAKRRRRSNALALGDAANAGQDLGQGGGSALGAAASLGEASPPKSMPSALAAGRSATGFTPTYSRPARTASA